MHTHTPPGASRCLCAVQRPLVESEGNLDPMDAYVTAKLLREGPGGKGALEAELAVFSSIVDAKWESWTSQDPLDLGEALWLTHHYQEEDWALAMTEVCEAGCGRSHNLPTANTQRSLSSLAL